jgi:hypothetical protein
MGHQETIPASGSGPSIEQVAALAKRLLGEIAGGQSDRTKTIVSALSITSKRISRLNDDLDRANADKLRLMTELNDANAQTLSAEAKYNALLAKYVDLAKRVIENDDQHQISVNERIEAAVYSNSIALEAGLFADIAPSHAQNFINNAAQPI